MTVCILSLSNVIKSGITGQETLADVCMINPSTVLLESRLCTCTQQSSRIPTIRNCFESCLRFSGCGGFLNHFYFNAEPGI